MTCPACQAQAPFRIFAAREMMFGWRHRFDYAECSACGTLHLVRVPPNLAEYYPPDYGSLVAPAGDGSRRALRAWVGRWLVDAPSDSTRRFAQALAAKFPFLHWARLARTRADAAILDVGCGNGGLLRRMRRWGFSNLTGVDPFATVDIDQPGFRVTRGDLAETRGKFDLVMFHHVLEHMPDPVGALREAREKLRTDGRILVRLPLAASRAARAYGPDWFNLDPPRHLVIPSLAGVRAIARAAGLAIAHEEFDADETSFTLSECYRRDVPMREAGNRIAAADQRRFRRLARQLNASGEADRGVFVMVPA